MGKQIGLLKKISKIYEYIYPLKTQILLNLGVRFLSNLNILFETLHLFEIHFFRSLSDLVLMVQLELDYS